MTSKINFKFITIFFCAFVLFACSSNENNKNVANQIEINEPVNTPEIKDYPFRNTGYPPLNLVGKNYSIPAGVEGIQKVKTNRDEFLSAGHSSSLELSEDKLYTVFYNYSPEGTGFTALVGYPVDASVETPEGLTVMTIPGGQYGVFPFANDSDSSYYQAWEAAEKVKEFRSFQTDIEVYNYNKDENSISNSELRVHLK